MGGGRVGMSTTANSIQNKIGGYGMKKAVFLNKSAVLGIFTGNIAPKNCVVTTWMIWLRNKILLLLAGKDTVVLNAKIIRGNGKSCRVILCGNGLVVNNEIE